MFEIIEKRRGNINDMHIDIRQIVKINKKLVNKKAVYITIIRRFSVATQQNNNQYRIIH